MNLTTGVISELSTAKDRPFQKIANSANPSLQTVFLGFARFLEIFGELALNFPFIHFHLKCTMISEENT